MSAGAGAEVADLDDDEAKAVSSLTPLSGEDGGARRPGTSSY